MLNKIFGWNRKSENSDPDIAFGRYSDNNKPKAKINSWTDADTKYRAKNYTEAMDSFFDYLHDEKVKNVVYERNGNSGKFELCQGSKIVKGKFDSNRIEAEITLARMPQPSVPVMRKLLEMNFSLFYSRFALDGDRLCMRFDSEMAAATPGKLYYGLKELATRGDKQDDLLVLDFSSLQKTGHDHTSELSQQEKDVKYEFLTRWIRETLQLSNSLDQAQFSGGISYMLLSLLFRVDYLICPEGRLLNELEKIIGIYYKNDNRPVMDKNRDMMEALQKILEKPKEEIVQAFFKSKFTFSIVAPQPYKAVVDSISGSLQNLPWYRENNHPRIANQVMEYGISFCQYSYSLPRVVTDLFHLYMRVNYPDYFSALGFKDELFNPSTREFNSRAIHSKLGDILEEWKEKYPRIRFRTEILRYDGIVSFNHSFIQELMNLNLEG